MDDSHILNNILSLFDSDGCNGIVRSCETSEQIFSMERNETDIMNHTFLGSVEETR